MELTFEADCFLAYKSLTTLDKIYTNIADRYLQPSILQNHDHLYPEYAEYTLTLNCIKVTVRSNSRTGMMLLVNELTKCGWSCLEQEKNVDTNIAYFNSRVMSLSDTYLPVRVVRRPTADKPWITDEFRQLLRRQYAWTNGETNRYSRQLRYKINCMSR
jgi:hypothetical protein